MNNQKNIDNAAENQSPELLTTPIGEQGKASAQQSKKQDEFGGRKNGPEPTRYGDWELKGKCVDF
jgi:hypothetical protein|tara:strand:+ start:243567 stop:243761 length:195 start_codon:yes stop_codon:yes gene_type:complete